MPSITLCEITRDNFQECLRLQPAPGQEHFVASTVYSLAEARVEPTLTPLAVYDGARMVGFAMWGHDPDENRYWILRLLIDRADQGKGYGRAALTEVISRLSRLPDCTSISISYHPDNRVAERLYESLGFRRTGERLGHEVVARLDLPAQPGAQPLPE